MPAYEEAFQILKKTFTESPVLVMLDTRKPFYIKCDASDFATGAVLSQLAPDGKWHPCAYISKLLSPTERNYPIYNKELLAVVWAFEAWRHYLEGADHPVDVWTDHKNLEWFRSSQKLNRQQAWWSLYLSCFDYKLTHKVGVTNKSDGLSWRPDHKKGVEFDNSGETLLEPKLFNDIEKIQRPFAEINAVNTEDSWDPHQMLHIRATGWGGVTIIDDDLRKQIIEENRKDEWLLETLAKVKTLGPQSMKKGLQEWNDEEGLVLHRGKIYVPQNEQLHQEIIKLNHNNLAAGHCYELAYVSYFLPSSS